MSKSYLTAISRKNPSLPMKKLDKEGRLIGRLLDYGSGRGFDASHFGMFPFDPHYSPIPPNGLFQTITCNYVLNTIKSYTARNKIIKDIISMLTTNGKAYITVRSNPKELHGETSRGTWQGLVIIPYPVFYNCASFTIYQLSK